MLGSHPEYVQLHRATLHRSYNLGLSTSLGEIKGRIPNNFVDIVLRPHWHCSIIGVFPQR